MTEKTSMEKVTTASWTIATIFSTHIKVKSFAAICMLLVDKIIVWNELLITLIFMLYFLDLLIWIILAIRKREFEKEKFFMWVSKLLIYWIFILIWVSLDEALYSWIIFTSSIFAFIIVTDALSILTNLTALWYNTPVFLKNYLTSYKNNLDVQNKTPKWN